MEIPKIKAFRCEAFDFNNKSLGKLNNLQFLDFRRRIKESEATGYYMMYKSKKIHIDKHGEIEDYPDGFYDQELNALLKLL